MSGISIFLAWKVLDLIIIITSLQVPACHLTVVFASFFCETVRTFDILFFRRALRLLREHFKIQTAFRTFYRLSTEKKDTEFLFFQ